MRFNIYVTLFILSLLTSFNLRAQIVINEISYNPPESGNDSLEYIELYNAGSSAVDITGWHFKTGVEDTFPSIQLNAGAFYVTAIKASAIQNVFGVNAHQWSAGALRNGGESIILVDASNVFVDSVAYLNTDPWPAEANGMGPSLELSDVASDNNDGANWQNSGGITGVVINGHEVFGTPGATNSGGGSSEGPKVTVSVADFQFTPKNVVVAIGDSVRWINNEGIPHNVNGKQTQFPTNSENFFSGAPVAGPWQFDFQFTHPGLNNYRCDLHFGGGMAGTVSVYDPNNFTDFPFAFLRTTDGVNGSNIFDGVPTRVTGVVHGINFLPTGYSFYVIDNNNVGINVFSFDPGTYTVQEGDNVTVEGTIDQFNGLLEIVPSDIHVNSTGNSLVAPDLTVDITEDVESSHIAFGPFTIDSIVTTGTSGFNVYTTHQTGNKVLVRVDADLGLDVTDIQGKNYVRGIGTQFDASFPFTTGYQILAFEFQTVNSVNSLEKDAIRMSPNPATSFINLDTDYTISSVQISSMDGRLIRNQTFESSEVKMNTSGIPQGHYIISANTDKGLWTSVLSIVQ